jgi:hypothetical protein
MMIGPGPHGPGPVTLSTDDRDERGPAMAMDERYIAGPNGLVYHVQIVSDVDSTPHDADCYSPEDIERWEECRWEYVGIVVNVENVPAEVSVWGFEWGFLREDGTVLDWDYYLSPESGMIVDGVPGPSVIDGLMEEARGAARRERDRLNALPL